MDDAGPAVAGEGEEEAEETGGNPPSPTEFRKGMSRSDRARLIWKKRREAQLAIRESPDDSTDTTSPPRSARAGALRKKREGQLPAREDPRPPAEKKETEKRTPKKRTRRSEATRLTEADQQGQR